MKWVAWGFGCLFFLLALAACSTQTPSSLPGATPGTVTPTPLPATETPIVPTAVPTIGPTSNITLTVWAPEEFSPESAHGGQVLQAQLDEFSRSHPDIRVNYVLKNREGKGGLLDFLLKVQSLVPERLPDLIVLDSKQMDAVAKADLLHPLDHDLPAGAMADLIPPAQKFARSDGAWLSLPVTLDIQHLAVNKQSVRTPPATWDQLLSGTASFAFPADDDDAFLFQYLQNHGRLSTATQPTPLDPAVILNVLTFFQRARAANLVPDSTMSVKTVHDVWPVFAEGHAAMAQVDASDYLAGSSKVPNTSFAPLPTQDGTPATLVSSWNYGIVTADPRRQAAAAELLNWLNEPSRIAEWATAANMVPARRSAFAQATMPPEYADFLLTLLENGIVAPTLAERAPFGSGWHDALQAVLRGQSTPAEAAPKAAQLANP